MNANENLKMVRNAFWNIQKAIKNGNKGVTRNDSVVSSWKVITDFFSINRNDESAWFNVFGKYTGFAKNWICFHRIQHLRGYRYLFRKVDESLIDVYDKLYNG